MYIASYTTIFNKSSPILGTKHAELKYFLLTDRIIYIETSTSQQRHLVTIITLCFKISSNEIRQEFFSKLSALN